MASISIKTYVQTLLSLVEGAESSQVSERIQLFLSLIKKNKDEKKLHEISRVFEREFYKMKGIEKGVIKSSFHLTEDEIGAIEKTLEEKLKTKVMVKNETDNNVLGGFKFFSEDHVLDASVNKKINDLEKSFSD